MAENSPLETAVTTHVNGSDMPSWERMQYKAFRTWVNHKLSARPWPAVGLLETGFEDGLTLAALLEILSGKQVAPPGALVKNAKIRIQKLNNLDYSFKFMEREGIRLENIGGEDIVDDNRKLILGLIWTLILHYQISMFNETPRTGASPRVPGKAPPRGDRPKTPAKEALLKRVNDRITPLTAPVKDFDVSFQNGIPFCALIHAHNPNLIPFNSLKPENKKENLNLAFKAMKDNYGLPPMLDADEMLENKPDDKAVMAYVGSMLPLLTDKPAFVPAAPVADTPPLPSAAAPPVPPPRASARESTLNSNPIPSGPNNTLELESPLRFIPSFQVVAKEDNGAPIRRGGAAFESWISGPTPISVKLVDLQNGTYDLALTPSLVSASPGIYELHVTLDRADIKGSPVFIVIAAAKLPPLARASQLSSAPAAQADSNALSLNLPLKSAPNFRVQTRDANGAPAPLGTTKLDAWITGPSSLSARVDEPPAASNSADYTITIWPPLTSALPGRYELNVKLGGEHVSGSPLTILLREPVVEAPKLSARNSQLQSTPQANSGTLEIATPLQGTPPTFQIVAKDETGQPMKTGGGQFRAWVNGPPNTSLTARVDDGGNGIYGVVVSPPFASSAPGRYELYVQRDQVSVAGSPLIVVVKPPVAVSEARETTLTMNPSRRSLAQPASPAALSELDKLLNNLSSPQPEAPPVPPPRAARASPLNSTLVSRPPADAGSNQLKVTLPVTVSPVFTLQTKDDDGKYVTRGGDTVTAYIYGPKGRQPVDVTDKQIGSYELTLVEPLTIPGRYELHVSLNGTPIRGSPFVIEVAEPPMTAQLARQSTVPQTVTVTVTTTVPRAAPAPNALPTAADADVIVVTLSQLPPARAFDEPSVVKALKAVPPSAANELRAAATGDLDNADSAPKQPWSDASERDIIDAMQPITADLIAEVTDAPQKRSYDLSKVLQAVIRMLGLAKRTILLIEDRGDIVNIVAGSRTMVLSFLKLLVAFDMLRYRAESDAQILLVSVAQRFLQDYEALRNLLIAALLKQRRLAASRAPAASTLSRTSSYAPASPVAPPTTSSRASTYNLSAPSVNFVTVVSLPRMDGAATLVVESLPQNNAQFIAYNFVPLDELCTAIAQVVRELHPQLGLLDQRRLAEAVQGVLADAKQMRVLQNGRNYDAYTQLKPLFIAHVRTLVALVMSLAGSLQGSSSRSAAPPSSPAPTQVTVTVRSTQPAVTTANAPAAPLPPALPVTYTISLDIRALKRILDDTIAEIIQASREVSDASDKKLLSNLAIELSGADLPVVQAMESQDNTLVVQEHQKFVQRLRSASQTLEEVARRERAREDMRRLRCSACRNEINGGYMQSPNGNFHNDCFRCTTCRSQMNSQYYFVNGLFYCPNHPPQ